MSTEVIDILRDLHSRQRIDIVKKICSAKEAMYILGFTSKSSFYALLKDSNCLITKSLLQGKYSLESVNLEADRLNGEL